MRCRASQLLVNIRNFSAQPHNLACNSPAAVSQRPHDAARLLINVACNSPTPLSNIETRTLIFRGFWSTPRRAHRGIACEIWGGLSAEPAVSRGIDGIYGRMQTQSLPGHPWPQPQRCPKRRPPLLKPPKSSPCGQGGLRFGQITGEGHTHQHATADTTLTTESTARPHPSARNIDCCTTSATDGTHADRLRAHG